MSICSQVYHLSFNETSITGLHQWSGGAWKVVNGFEAPASTKKIGKVYVFSDGRWPFYVGKATQPIRNRIRGAFKATPENRIAGFAGYRFKRDRTDAVIHVFTAQGAAHWSGQDAECIEAEVVYRVRTEGAWPEYQTEIHFSKPNEMHSAAADSIFSVFKNLKDSGGLKLPASDN
jgi:hypothetical protein